jgi:hypothetical protein
MLFTRFGHGGGGISEFFFGGRLQPISSDCGLA